MASFPADIIAAAQASELKWQIPASVTLAQWAVESAFGASTPKGSNNVFGIKALPGQAAVNAKTGEVINGVSQFIIGAFRVFPSIAAAFDAHGRLLGLGKPYHDMVTAYLRNRNVYTLARALTGVYATAPDYGAVLVTTIMKYDLTQYDRANLGIPTETKPVPTDPVTTADKSSPPPQLAPTGHAPTVSQSIQIDWGSWAAQLLIHETPIIEAGVDAAYQAFAPAMLKLFVGPKLINQYIEQGLLALESVLNPQTISVDESNMILATVARMINANEAAIANFFGLELEPMITAQLKKLGLAA